VKNLFKIIRPLNKTLLFAGIYNILWGCWVVGNPRLIFTLAHMPHPNYIEIWQCVGMIVGVYGLGYLIAAANPLKHWPIVLVGFLGKTFGPIGFVIAIYKDVFPLSFGINIIFNDLIWWPCFLGILIKTYHSYYSKKELTQLDKEKIEDLDHRYRAKFINSLSGFKSVNLLGTQDLKGNTNLSIISSVFHLGASPALLGFILRPDSARRDSLINLRMNPFFTLNHVNKSILKESHQTSARYDQIVSEFKACGLTSVHLKDHPAPYVQESPIRMGLKMIREQIIEENGTHLIIAEIINTQFPKDCLEEDGSLNISKAGTISVSGLDTYSEGIKIGKLSYAKPDKELSWLD